MPNHGNFRMLTMYIKDENPIGCVPFFGDEEGEMPLIESRANALIAVKCCIENNRGATSSTGGIDTPRSDHKNWNAI